MFQHLDKVVLAFIVIGLPTILIFGQPIIRRMLDLREKRMEIEARLAAEKAAQYAASNAELEQRVRILEQIVTDGGAQTAAQIEALREHTRLEGGDKGR